MDQQPGEEMHRAESPKGELLNSWSLGSSTVDIEAYWFPNGKALRTSGLFFWATPMAHGGSQARGQIGAAAASLHHSSQQHQIFNPPSEARDWTRNLLVPSSTMGTPSFFFFFVFCFLFFVFCFLFFVFLSFVSCEFLYYMSLFFLFVLYAYRKELIKCLF